MLIEAGPRVLAGFPDDLSAYALRSLKQLGVEVVLGQAVTECSADGVMYGGKNLQAKTLIWAAGVRASPAAEWLGAPADRAGRLEVNPDLTVPGHPDIFAIGDTVAVAGPDGKPVPGIAPAAKQQGRYVAAAIRARLRGETVAPFRYKHSGSLAQIGKHKAVIDFGRFKLQRRDGLVDLGHRAHLFPDRPAQPAQRRAELAVDPRPRPARRAADHARLQQGGRPRTDHGPCLQNKQIRLSYFAAASIIGAHEVNQAPDNVYRF